MFTHVPFHLYSSYFKLHVLRLRSFTPVTYLCKHLGIHSLVAFLQLELFRVYKYKNQEMADESRARKKN
ncbi:hypothetical protein CIG68_02905 [Escherichia coli]|nr:hypothetical protein CIG68_02905 [Escherichia coli]